MDLGHLPRWLAVALLLLVAYTLFGCAGLSLPADPSRMTADQLREWVRDKSAAIQCARTETPYKFGVVAINLDKGIVPNGKVTIDDGCKITIENATPARP